MNDFLPRAKFRLVPSSMIHETLINVHQHRAYSGDHVKAMKS